MGIVAEINPSRPPQAGAMKAVYQLLLHGIQGISQVSVRAGCVTRRFCLPGNSHRPEQPANIIGRFA